MNRRAGLIRYVIISLMFGMVVLSATFCHQPVKSAKQNFLAILDTTHHYLNINDTVKYVGAKTCMLCHQDIYNSFIHTGMGESFDAAGKHKSAAKFGPHVVVHDKINDFYYHPFWKSDSLYVLEFRMKGKDTVYKRAQQVNYIIGSGMHTNSHIYRVNGYLNQVPITFYTQEGRWDLAPGFSDGYNSRFNRELGLECMTCHNSYPDFVMGSTNKYKSVPNGITCERCHGPGEVHVMAMQLGHRVDTAKAIDYTIVNPLKLPVELQVDICERCHLQGNAVLKPGKSFYDFKPGTNLSDMEDVFMPEYTGMENEFIMASHIARLKMSKCYLNSLHSGGSDPLKPFVGALTCVTCHNPHIDVRSVSDNTFNTVCQNCHDKKVTEVCTDALADRQKVNDDCVSCHMPKGHTIDIPHVITTDHYIRIPPKKVDKEKIKKFITLYDVNNPNPTDYARGMAFIQQFARFESDYPLLLDSAKHYFPDNTPADVRRNFAPLVDISFYKQDYQRILYYTGILRPQYVLDSMLVQQDYSNADAWIAYRIGEAFFQNNNAQAANAFYGRAAKLAPYVLEFRNKLGASLVMLNRFDDAGKEYDFILTQDPDFVPALTNKGYIALRKGDAEKAKAYYDKALALSPDDKQALMNTAGWYIYKGDYSKAQDCLKHILRKYPDDVQAKTILQQLKAVHKKRA